MTQGQILDSILGGGYPAELKSDNTLAGPPAPRRGEAATGESFHVGPKTQGPIPPAQPKTKGGNLLSSLADGLYNRILLEPARLNVGTLVSTVTNPVQLWNGFFTNKTVTEVREIGTEGVLLLGGLPTPFTLPPLGLMDVAVEVSPQGPPTVDASIAWLVDSIYYSLAITGSRLVLLPVSPDWRSPPTERLDWLTDIITMVDGTEQRISLRNQPRRTSGYNASLTDNEAARLRNVLAFWQQRIFSAPVWTDKTFLSTSATVGSLVLQLDTTGRSFRTGGYLLLTSGGNQELAEIESFNTTSVTLSRGISNEWSAGTTVYPAASVTVPESISMTRVSAGAVRAKLELEWLPSEGPAIASAAIPQTFDGHEILLQQPNWSKDLDFTSIYGQTVVDYGTGVNLQLPKGSFPTQGWEHSWLLRGREKIADFKAFLLRRAGRRVPFYLPTFNQDFIPIAATHENERVLRVRAAQYLPVWESRTEPQLVLIRATGGRQWLRTITGVNTPAANQEDIFYDQELGVSLAADDFLGIHLLHLVRLASDSVEISWRTDEVAEVALNVLTVKE